MENNLEIADPSEGKSLLVASDSRILIGKTYYLETAY
jgi:hypothetical protein